MNFDAILSRIANGQSVSSEELLPYLCLERLEQRANANHLLAEAYLKSGRRDDLEHARTFIHRAWVLGKFPEELIPLYTQIHAALDDIAAIREAYKRLGVMMAAQGNLAQAIKYFDLWQYAYAAFRNVETYEFDFDILDCMDRLARPYMFSPRPRADLLTDKKIRVAYLVHAITGEGSVLVRINLLFAQFHDRSRVSPTFFVPETEREVLSSSAGREHLRLFESYGCKVTMAPDGGTTKDQLLSVAQQIHQSRPDVLVTSAALAHFNHYFITSLRPAPIVIGLLQGPPEQFAPPSLDWGISWPVHPVMDSPVDCTLTIMEVDLPGHMQLEPYERHDLKIPDEAPIIASAGRFHKFQDARYWEAIFDLLKNHPRLYFLGIGLQETQVPFLSEMISEETRSRIRFFGWRGNDYLRALSLANVFIDTFPSGGGTVVTDVMSLGIPIVAFKNNYFRRYQQTDWSPADESLEVPELLVQRGDFTEMKRVVSALIENPEQARDLGRRCQEHFQEMRSNPQRAIRRCEDLYFRIIETLSGNEYVDERSAEVAALARRQSRFRPAPRVVVAITRQLKRVLRFGERVLDRVAEGRLLRTNAES